MTRELKYEITEAYNGRTISDFLKEHRYSRGVIIHLKKMPDGILQNGMPAYVTEQLHTHDTLTVRICEDSSSEKIRPVPAPLNILYEDEDLFVLCKPAGMPTHPSIHHYDYTLANALTAYNEKKGQSLTFRCINRLDCDTSGLTIVAKHLLSSAILGTAMKERKIHREYLGIVQGLVEDCGTIYAPIARADNSIIAREVNFQTGEPAVTHFKRLKYENGLSLVSFVLETGRTHQIRVHMKYIGHPLIGDFLYHPDSRQMNRQALHGWHLDFLHPITGKEMHFTAPVPEDFLLKP